MGKIQESPRDAGCNPIGGHVDQAHRHQGVGPIGGKLEHRADVTQDLEPFRQRPRIEFQRAEGIEPLVAGQVPRIGETAPFAAREARRLRRSQGDRLLRGGRGVKSVGIDREDFGAHARARPCGFRDPSAGTFGVYGQRRDAVHHVETKRRLLHDVVADALEPMVPPAKRLLQKSHCGLGGSFMRIEMTPGTHGHLVRYGEIFRETQRGIAVQIRPAAPKPYGTGDRAVVEAHGTMLPVLIQRLMLEPEFGPKAFGLEPLQPHRAPALPDDLGIRGPCVEDLHDAAPPEIVVEQAAAGVMNAFGEAVIGPHHRDDRLQGRGSACRHLQRVIRAPGLAHHPDVPRTPGLAGNPLDHFERIVLFFRQILIVHHAVRLARTAHVDAHGGVAVARKPVMHALVAPAHEIAFPVGDVLEDRRYRCLFRVCGRPNPRREAAAVR